MSDTTSTTSTGAGQKKGMSEKRKMQNRLAQQKYRKRVKASAESSRVAVEEKRDEPLTPPWQCESISQSMNHETEMLASINVVNDGEFGSDLLFDEFPDFGLPVMGDALGNAQIASLNDSDDLFSLIEQSPSSIDESSGITDTDINLDSYFDQLSSVDLSFTGFGSDLQLSTTPHQKRTRNTSPPSKLAPQIRRKQLNAYPISPPSTSSSDIDTIATGLIDQLNLDSTNENKSLIKTTLARGHNIRDVLLAGLAALGKKDGTIQTPIPHPQKTTAITLQRTSTIQAYMAIWTSMSFKIPEARPHEDWQTPFYQPQIQSPSHLNAIVASHITTSLPLCMRPTPAQISYPHLAWVDVIPFPSLRERIVSEMAQNPALNAEELKDDLFMKNGLFCWRSSENGGSGQPWDMRSWEAEPWFLRKWMVLLGGEGGEVWRQTQWWRAMRGKGM